MEDIKTIAGLITDVVPVILAAGASLGALWMYVFHGRKKKAAATEAVTTPSSIIQGTPVSPAQDQFELRTLFILERRIEQLEKQLEDAHNALRDAGKLIP